MKLKMNGFDWTRRRKFDRSWLRNTKNTVRFNQLFASKNTLHCQSAYRDAYSELSVTVSTLSYFPYEEWKYCQLGANFQNENGTVMFPRP